MVSGLPERLRKKSTQLGLWSFGIARMWQIRERPCGPRDDDGKANLAARKRMPRPVRVSLRTPGAHVERLGIDGDRQLVGISAFTTGAPYRSSQSADSRPCRLISTPSAPPLRPVTWARPWASSALSKRALSAASRRLMTAPIWTKQFDTNWTINRALRATGRPRVQSLRQVRQLPTSSSVIGRVN